MQMRKPKSEAIDVDRQRIDEERHGLKLKFSVVGEPVFQLGAQGVAIEGQPPELGLRRFARLDGRYAHGDREVAADLSFVVMGDDELKDRRPDGDRFTVGYYRITKGSMAATVWGLQSDIAMIASSPSIWTSMWLHISRPTRGSGDVWGWSINAGEIWSDVEEG